MEILLTNDDGIQARGLEILASEMEKLGHVTIVAPDGPRSGNSNAVTMGLPIRIRQVSDTVTRSTYVSNGTPSDCVKLGLEVIYKNRRPDILIAGINHGSNAAVNVIYSGTMGAVFVGNEQGVPSIGFSLDDHRPDADFSFMQPYLIPLVKLLVDKGTDACWNINAPKGGIKAGNSPDNAMDYGSKMWLNKQTLSAIKAIGLQVTSKIPSLKRQTPTSTPWSTATLPSVR